MMPTQEVEEIRPGQQKVKRAGNRVSQNPLRDLIFWSPWTLGQVWALALVSLMTNANLFSYPECMRATRLGT